MEKETQAPDMNGAHKRATKEAGLNHSTREVVKGDECTDTTSSPLKPLVEEKWEGELKCEEHSGRWPWQAWMGTRRKRNTGRSLEGKGDASCRQQQFPQANTGGGRPGCWQRGWAYRNSKRPPQTVKPIIKEIDGQKENPSVKKQLNLNVALDGGKMMGVPLPPPSPRYYHRVKKMTVDATTRPLKITILWLQMITINYWN